MADESPPAIRGASHRALDGATQPVAEGSVRSVGRLKQRQHVRDAHLGASVGAAQQLERKVSLLVMERDDALLDGLRQDQPIRCDRPGLTDAVRAVGGLVFDGGVPPWVQVDDVVCSRQVLKS